MPVLVETPGEVSLGVLRWLTPLEAQPEALKNTEPIDPSRLSQLLDFDLMQATECLTLWCYVRLLQQLLDLDQKPVEALRRALRVPNPFDASALEYINRMNAIESLELSNLFNEVPEELVRGFSEIVITFLTQHQHPPRPLMGLESIVFQHPADRALLQALEAVPLAGEVMGAAVDVIARAEELRLLSGSIEVTEASLPPLYECYIAAAETLGIDHPPCLYVEQGGINAYTTGADRPYVVISSLAVSLLNRPETMFVLGHELGHVMAGHVRYHTLARFLHGAAGIGLSQIPVAGPIAKLVTDVTLKPALFAWYRRSEFTADRAGLLACQNREAALRVLMKLAGYPPSGYSGMRTRSLVDQVLRYDENLTGSTSDRLLDLVMLAGETHPRTVTRAYELLEWQAEGAYAELVRADEAMLHRLARGTKEDPQAELLHTRVARSITAWAVERYGAPKREIAPQVRRMLYLSQAPTQPQVAAIMRVELHVRKDDASTVSYRVLLLAHDGGQPFQVEIPVPMETSRDSLPAELRHAFVKSGERELVHVLYTVE